MDIVWKSYFKEMSFAIIKNLLLLFMDERGRERKREKKTRIAKQTISQLLSLLNVEFLLRNNPRNNRNIVFFSYTIGIFDCIAEERYYYYCNFFGQCIAQCESYRRIRYVRFKWRKFDLRLESRTPIPFEGKSNWCQQRAQDFIYFVPCASFFLFFREKIHFDRKRKSDKWINYQDKWKGNWQLKDLSIWNCMELRNYMKLHTFVESRVKERRSSLFKN